MNILIIFGTRPEAIKMAPLIQAISNNPKFNGKVCVTGQHREMLQQVLDIFDIEPDYSLATMTENQSLSEIFARLIESLGNILHKEAPDAVAVQGDTATTFAASLAAYFQKIPVLHVEAGLRTGNMYAPWPEEGNRKLTATLTRWHFAPTLVAKDNLLSEGFDPASVWVTGNTVIDSLHTVREKLSSDTELYARLEKLYSFLNPDKRLILITGHRRESFGRGFKNICIALAEISRRNDVELIYPVHLNPNVKEPVQHALKNRPNIFLQEPVDYIEMVYLLQRCYLVLTDSGGIQEEAPALGKPVLVMRDTSERPEAIDAGTAMLVGTGKEQIVSAVYKLLTDHKKYSSMAQAINPFGDGTAAKQIIEILSREWH
ncbi:MAG: UDP-N-acetylglucosamine 2-epimerase (non-hydrolyzing) [Candidatus Dadabacteria bacterium]|nr:UDP-N-acetylglucosamine 2-epimerase (non-hydrolyzing) [Candidatus Dadabacteria bacterium]